MVAEDAPVVSDRERAFHLKRRQALLIELAAIEEYLGMERSVTPKRQRGARRCGDAEAPTADS